VSFGQRRFIHPLCGADLATLLALLRANRPLTRAALPRVTVALLAALGRAPMSGLSG